MIGVNILGWAKQFTEAYEAGGDIAVHTWTHPYMTTLSNLDVVAQVRIFFSAFLKSCPHFKSAWVDNGDHP